MPFDPGQPFEKVVGGFDPNQPFEAVKPQTPEDRRNIISQARTIHAERQNPSEIGPELPPGKLLAEQQAEDIGKKAVQNVGDYAALRTAMMPAKSLASMVGVGAASGAIGEGARPPEQGETRMGNAIQGAGVGGGLAGLLGGAGKLLMRGSAPAMRAAAGIKQDPALGTAGAKAANEAAQTLVEEGIIGTRNKMLDQTNNAISSHAQQRASTLAELIAPIHGGKAAANIRGQLATSEAGGIPIAGSQAERSLINNRANDAIFRRPMNPTQAQEFAEKTASKGYREGEPLPAAEAKIRQAESRGYKESINEAEQRELGTNDIATQNAAMAKLYPGKYALQDAPAEGLRKAVIQPAALSGLAQVLDKSGKILQTAAPAIGAKEAKRDSGNLP